MSIVIRSKAPLRIGLAGGGTDVSPYSELYGGAILNATISMYAYATLEPDPQGEVVRFQSIDRGEDVTCPLNRPVEVENPLVLHRGAYNHVLQQFGPLPSGFKLSTYVDAPAGSGLGTSSTLLVAILGAFSEWLQIPWGEYDLAHLAWRIEREELAMAGGKQDQYAATFGGFNFMEFSSNGNVIVNPLRIKPELADELEFSILMFYTGTSRLSSQIIESQSRNVIEKKETALEAMHHLKAQAYQMKESVLKGRLDDIGPILDYGWRYKKQSAQEISNSLIDDMYQSAIEAGSTGGKISGAGGGGFMMFYCPGNTRYSVIKALQPFGGEFRRFQFTQSGIKTWTLKR